MEGFWCTQDDNFSKPQPVARGQPPDIAMAQTSTATVNDYLSDVRIFAPGSPDFAKIASSLGVDATLPTLGPGASLVSAIRNDSGEAVDSMRILFQGQKGGGTFSRIALGGSLAAGGSTLIAPTGLDVALLALLHPQQGASHNTAHPQTDYTGVEMTTSIDSVSLANGKFLGADTLGFFSRLAAEDATKKSFFSAVAGYQAAGLTQSQITQALKDRKAAADSAKRKTTSVTDLDLGAMEESRLCGRALVKLQQFGMANLSAWATEENAKAQSKPTLHK
jgi:hypothetical protein